MVVLMSHYRALLLLSIFPSNNYCLLVLRQRDMAERGHSLESIKASIESRKPDFDAFIGMSSAR
jgi:uridine kinase